MTPKKIKHYILFLSFGWKWPENFFELTNTELIYLTFTQKSTTNWYWFYLAHLFKYFFIFQV